MGRPVELEILIDEEVKLYVDFCNKASLHDEQEALWRQLAHVTFYHIQELKSAGLPKTPIS